MRALVAKRHGRRAALLQPAALALAVGLVLAIWLLALAPVASSAPAGWRVVAAATPRRDGAAALTGVSCTSSSFCMAVGASHHGSDVLAEELRGRRWRIVTPPEPHRSAELTSVSCRSPRWCLAVGYAVIPPAAKEPLAEFWNGRSWRAQVLTVPAGLGPGGWSLLEGVSCPSVARCYAVGQTGPEQPDQELDLFATWTRGQGWTHTSLNQVQTIVLNLSGVSCSSLNACFAVGQSNWKDGNAASAQDLYYAYQNVNGTDQWAGTTTDGTYNGVTLNAVSCPADYRCMAVGPVAAGGDLPGLLTSISFTLTTGTEQPVQAPAGASAASLSGIACPTTSSCTSVGDAETNGRVAPLAEHWDGKRWAIEPVGGAASSAASLAAVSCPSTAACIAVGERQSSPGSRRQPLIERWP